MLGFNRPGINKINLDGIRLIGLLVLVIIKNLVLARITLFAGRLVCLVNILVEGFFIGVVYSLLVELSLVVCRLRCILVKILCISLINFRILRSTVIIEQIRGSSIITLIKIIPRS